MSPGTEPSTQNVHVQCPIFWKRIGNSISQVLFLKFHETFQLAVCQNPIPLVNIKIAGKWMFIPLNMVLIGIDP
jgi:hypothetical protein